MSKLPGNVQRILTKDEQILDSFNIKSAFGTTSQRIFCTNKRIIILDNRAGLFSSHVYDIAYDHISSIDLKSSPQQLLLVLAALFIVVSIPFWQNILEFEENISILLAASFLVVGILLILLSFFFKSYRLEIFTSGRNNPVLIKSCRTDLEQILMFSRERIV